MADEQLSSFDLTLGGRSGVINWPNLSITVSQGIGRLEEMGERGNGQ